MKFRELKRLYESEGAERTCSRLTEAIQAKHLRAEDFSLRECARAFCGEQFVENLNPRSKAGGLPLLEAGDAVSVAAFSNITGQIVYSRIMQAYQNPAFVMSSIVPNVPTTLSGEKIPGMTQIGDQAEVVTEGKEYPTAGFTEDYVETPATTKRGLIVPVTKEAVFFDRTNLILQRASDVGTWLATNKEKRLVDILIGKVNTYKWKGTTYNTYNTSTPWINSKSSNDLVDWTDIDNVLQLFADMRDPHTGEPILMMANTLICMPARFMAAKRVLNATEIRFNDGASNSTQTVAANPVSGMFNIQQSVLAYARLQSELSVSAANAGKYYYIGDFQKAFAYMENWPVTVVQAPANGEDEFSRDIVAKYKASERGAAAVMEPRCVVQSYEA